MKYSDYKQLSKEGKKEMDYNYKKQKMAFLFGDFCFLITIIAYGFYTISKDSQLYYLSLFSVMAFIIINGVVIIQDKKLLKRDRGY
jgi:hypothetical protein